MKLTCMESYQAAYALLDSIWQSMDEDEQEQMSELDTLLAGMFITPEGDSAEPEVWELWRSTAAELCGRGSRDALSPELAYEVMLRFLRRWVESSDGTIQGVYDALVSTGADREDWDEVVRRVAAGEFDPIFGLERPFQG